MLLRKSENICKHYGVTHKKMKFVICGSVDKNTGCCMYWGTERHFKP